MNRKWNAVSVFVVSLLTASPGYSSDLKEISDWELQQKAKAELQTTPAGTPEDPQKVQMNQIVVPSLWNEEAETRPWRIGVSFQSYSFGGQIKSTTGESFSLNETESTPLFGVNLCRDLIELPSRLNVGTCLDLLYGRQKLNLETSTGTTYRNVTVNVFIPTVSSQLGWQPFARLPLHISVMAGIAPYILVRNSKDKLVDGTDYSTSYVAGMSSRFDFWRRVYIQGSYEFRDLIFNESTQAIQNHNFLASAGLIF